MNLPFRQLAGLGLLLFANGCAQEQAGLSSEVNLPPLPSPPFAITEAGIALGRQLFFDVRLSGNDRISCATCHRPELAFADGLSRSNLGATGIMLDRNTPGLTNIAWAPSLFWDGGAKNLESLVLAPLTNPNEMAENPSQLMAQLAADDHYREAFATAFPQEGLSLSSVMKAISGFMRSLVSANSRYDRAVRGEDAKLSSAEQAGQAVYATHCARCHSTDLFTDQGFHNNGLDAQFPSDLTATGRGRARVTFDDADLGKYRTPTLRNLAYTAPYMHDGRFASLSDVLNHYRFGVVDSATVDSTLAPGIALFDEEAEQLLHFLDLLNDPDFVADAVAERPGEAN